MKESFMRRSCGWGFMLSMGVALLGVGTSLDVTKALGTVVHVPFEEAAQTADLIFVGTVEKQQSRLNEKNTMIFTDVDFTNISIVYATERSVQKDSKGIRLTYAGGKIGDWALEVSDTPRFETGRRYLVLMLDDGKTYSSPIVGGPQGLFEVRVDSTGQEYVVSSDGRAVVSAGPGGLKFSSRRVASIENGALVPNESDSAPMIVHVPPGLPSGPGMSSAVSEIYRKDTREQALKIEDFSRYIIEGALTEPSRGGRIIKPADSQGKFYRNLNGVIVAEDLKLSSPVARPLPASSSSSGAKGQNSGGTPVIMGDPLGRCGYHELPIVMQTVPESWPEFQMISDCLWTWNNYMNIYVGQYSDGTFGHDNGQNEFGGYVDSATLQAAYGFSWKPQDVAVCCSLHKGECGEIIESDIFWNSALNWTDDENLGIGNKTVTMIRPATMHELGHSWGMQRVTYPETNYAYDYPTVMQAIYHDVVENGRGIHTVDAAFLRLAYDDQTNILGFIDVGVESYYASAGLHNSTTDKNYYLPGESITFKNVTIENMSSVAVDDVRLRFYLSWDNEITESDYQLGSYFYWDTFDLNGIAVGDFTVMIPPEILPGQYYVGAIVTINGFNTDMFSYNNSTYFYETCCDPNNPVRTVTIGPAAPVNLNASDGTYYDQIMVNWSFYPGAEACELWRNTINNPNTASLIFSGLKANYEDKGDKNVIAGQTYYYWVRAVTTEYGTSRFSSPDSGYRRLAAPTGVTASDGTYTDKVLVTWKPVQGAVLSYTVFRKEAGSAGMDEELGSADTTSFNDTTAAPGLKYSYTVKADCFGGSSDSSKGDNGYRKLAAPTNVVASDADAPLFMDKVVISWYGVYGATSYTVYRATSATGKNPTLLGTVATWPYEDSTGTPELVYYYFVKANNAYGSSALSAPDAGHRKLPAPTGVSASDGTYADKVVVTWNSVSGAKSYQIFRADEMWETKTQLGTVSGRSKMPSFNDSTATPGAFYYYWVKAVSKNGTSDFSDPWDTGYRKLPVPTGVSASDGTYPDKVRVTWNPVQGAAQYLIYRSTLSSGGQADIGGSVTTTYDDITASPGTTYYYWVKALWSHDGNLSDYSAPDPGWRAVEVPSPPTLLSPTNGATEVSTNPTFSWIASRGATSYQLQVATDSGFTQVVFNQNGIAGTSQVANGLHGGGLYYWRINATNTAGTSPWSNVWSFTTAR
jgi:fibronectin type 3 domain-containing protein